MTQLSPFRFTIVSEENRSAALQFIETWGKRWHNCSPPPTTGVIIGAYEHNEIVGTVCLDFRDENAPFYLENIYDFSDIYRHFPELKRTMVVQGGRWFASRPTISRTLLHAIAEYCMPRGIRYLLTEVKESSIKRLEELQIRFVIVYGIPPRIDAVPPEGRQYYLDPPSPRLMLCTMEDLLMTPPASILEQ